MFGLHHGTEFEHLKGPAVFPYPDMTEEHGPPGIKLNQNSDSQEERTKHNEPNQG